MPYYRRPGRILVTNHTIQNKQIVVKQLGGSTLWRPYLLKDNEKVQRCAIKFILSDYSSDYSTRLSVLPLMYIYEIHNSRICKPCLYFILEGIVPTLNSKEISINTYELPMTQERSIEICVEIHLITCVI